MKTILKSIILLTFSLNALAFDRMAASLLLEEKKVSLVNLERSGSQLLLGEITGAGRSNPLNQIQVIFIQNEAILKSEIESMDGNTLSNMQSFRAKGTYFLNSDIKGVVLKR